MSWLVAIFWGALVYLILRDEGTDFFLDWQWWLLVFGGRLMYDFGRLAARQTTDSRRG